jgi:uncharacterized protein
MRNPQYAAYKGAEPYFNLVRRALGDLVDGEHFFDIVADNVVYEVLYDIAGWPSLSRTAGLDRSLSFCVGVF